MHTVDKCARCEGCCIVMHCDAMGVNSWPPTALAVAQLLGIMPPHPTVHRPGCCCKDESCEESPMGRCARCKRCDKAVMVVCAVAWRRDGKSLVARRPIAGVEGRHSRGWLSLFRDFGARTVVVRRRIAAMVSRVHSVFL